MTLEALGTFTGRCTKHETGNSLGPSLGGNTGTSWEMPQAPLGPAGESHWVTTRRRAQRCRGNELGLLLGEALRMHWEILGRELRHWV
jgi:hypothetical protein